MSANDDATKLRVLGLLKAGGKAKDIARDEGVAYPKVLKWRKELDGMQADEDIQEILKVEPAVVHEIAEGVKERLEDLSEGSGELVESVVRDINKLMTLEEDMQESGIKLVKRINEMVDACTSPLELESLVTSLAKLQTAFFAKGSNVNVLNAPNASFSDSGVSTFSSMQRPS